MSAKPTKTIELEVLPNVARAASTRAERAIELHNAGKRSAAQQVIYAFLCGYELSQAKEECGHGGFMKWCEENLTPRGLPHRTATRYIQFADALQPKLATVANFDFGRLQLTNGQSIDALNPADREALESTIHEYADGKSITELYRDLGVIRQPKKQQYHPPKPLTPDQEAEAEEAQANDYFDALALDLEQLDQHLAALADPAKLETIRALLIDKGKLLDNTLRSARRAGHKPKKATK